MFTIKQENTIKFSIKSIRELPSKHIQSAMQFLKANYKAGQNIYPSAFGGLSVELININSSMEFHVLNKMKDSEIKEKLSAIISRIKMLNQESFMAAERHYAPEYKIGVYESHYPYAYGYMVCELMNIATELEQLISTK